MKLHQMSRHLLFPLGFAPTEEMMPTVSCVRTYFDIANSQVSFRIFGSEKSPSTPPILFFSSCKVSFLYLATKARYSFVPPFDAITEYTAPRMSGFIFPVLNIILALFIISLCPERPKREIQSERSKVSVCISFFFACHPRRFMVGEKRSRIRLFKLFCIFLFFAINCSSLAKPRAISSQTV